MNKIEAGTYKARGVEGSVQKGTSKSGTEQIALNLDIPSLGRQVTTFLYFSDNAIQYALDRLAALGWDGTPGKYNGISKNEVDVQIRYEMYDGKEQMKADIYTGGGQVVLKAPMQGQEERAFDDRIAKAFKQRSAEPSTADAAPAASGKYGAL